MKFTATLIFLLCAFGAQAQKQKFKGKPKPLPKDTIKFVAPQVMEVADSALLQHYGDPNGVEVPPTLEGDITTEEPMAIEAPAYAEPYYGEYYNKFIYKRDIKIEEHPDVQASYNAGTDSMIRELYEKVSVPYSYLGNDYYVLLQVTVGKDSALYNPVPLYSPESSYTINAQHAVEQLQGKFKPATKKGVPVNSTIIIPVRFMYLKNQERRYH